MPKVLNISDTESLSDHEDEMENLLHVGISCRSHVMDNGASSSGTNLRSSFIGMGFSPSLIDKVIKEKGEEDADLLLDTLFAYSAHEKLNSESSDSLDLPLYGSENNRNTHGCPSGSHLEQGFEVKKATSSESLDSLLDDEKDAEATSLNFHPKQEAGVIDDHGGKRASLLMMNFSVAEVDFAIDKLGYNAPIDELVDFIFAARIAESENGEDLPNDARGEKNEDGSTEALFGTMDKTLQLLAMGFNEHEVSLAIEKLGSAGPVMELANWICASQMGESYPIKTELDYSLPSMSKHSTLDGSWHLSKGRPDLRGDPFTIKTEPGVPYTPHGRMYAGIKPKEECYEDSSPYMKDFNVDDIKGKRPKEEPEDEFTTLHGSMWKKSRILTNGNNPFANRKISGDQFFGNKLPNPNPSRSVDKMVSGPPYFLYGSVLNLSIENWKKVSQFLYAIQPEFVLSQSFSALQRKEGYIHNLPTEDRFHMVPKSPMTIAEAMPDTLKWWPAWDTRKQLSCISSETSGAAHICNHLGKMLADSGGVPSGETQTKVLHYCRTMNLVWVGRHKLGPIEPEHLERILGYPMNHTRNPDMSLVDRLESLRNCFQTDTLGYHLSVLKDLFPGGITLLSIFSGIGGAEVTLHRLGIFLKGVVSVESSEAKRKILRRWWQNTDQSGELVQIDDIQRLTSSRLEVLGKKFGGFDLIICQSPSPVSPKGPNKVIPGSRDVGDLDFTLYFEYVRVLQRVRSMAGRR